MMAVALQLGGVMTEGDDARLSRLASHLVDLNQARARAQLEKDRLQMTVAQHAGVFAASPLSGEPACLLLPAAAPRDACHPTACPCPCLPATACHRLWGRLLRLLACLSACHCTCTLSPLCTSFARWTHSTRGTCCVIHMWSCVFFSDHHGGLLTTGIGPPYVVVCVLQRSPWRAAHHLYFFLHPTGLPSLNHVMDLVTLDLGFYIPRVCLPNTM